ncbi:MAG: TonB family protein [Brevundimonas sp.]|uniref:energy transducer TonB family protein n=1 Tax=Brevundimonas sp. TaxID=1871086 RepID=UPI00256413E4|nr:TonB family protein [Brevundimonas sp.]MDK2748885.1 TonB family protein [Brevundimonas sp.]
MTTVDEDGGGRGRWFGALAAVLALHAAPVVVAAWWLRPIPPLTPPEPALLIDMAPPAAPPVPLSEQPPGPRQVQADAPRPAIRKVAPEAPQAEAPEVVLPSHPTEPAAQPSSIPAPRTTAPPARAAVAAASLANGAPDWRGLVLARLDLVKRYPAAAEIRRQQGVPYIRIIMDRQGRVLDTQLERSSGVAALDREAMSLPRRAQPLPPPPAEVSGERIDLVVPVEFYLNRR